jgi:RNA polymerase sigma factor (sigma-70 family)
MAVTETGHAASRALDDLYRRHGGEIYRYALAVLGNHADAEDITQTTFLNAYRALEQGVRPRKPSNWLLTIASNAIKGRFRQERSRPRHVELDEQVAGTSPVADDAAPTVGELLTALSRIPPQQRQAIVLREFEGRSYKEIAEILGVTITALETLLFRARRSLAEELTQQLTCSEAQFAISRAADGRLGRKERRRLREHLAECPDCAHFARLQRRNRSALKSLLLVPVPLSLSLFKGLEGSAAAATGAVAVGAGATAVGTGLGTAGATGGGLFAGGLALKAAVVVTAAGVAGGVAVTGATEHQPAGRGQPPASPTTVKPGKSSTAPGRSVDNAQATGKADAPGQVRASGGAAPGRVVPPGQLRGDAAGRGKGEGSGAVPPGARGQGDERRAQTQPRASATAKPDEPGKAGARSARAKKRKQERAGTGLADALRPAETP